MKPDFKHPSVIEPHPSRIEDDFINRFRLLVEPDGTERLQVAVNWWDGFKHGTEWHDVPKVQA